MRIISLHRAEVLLDVNQTVERNIVLQCSLDHVDDRAPDLTLDLQRLQSGSQHLVPTPTAIRPLLERTTAAVGDDRGAAEAVLDGLDADELRGGLLGLAAIAVANAAHERYASKPA